jgi:perosamine synthetase
MPTYPMFKVHVDTNDALAQLRAVFESGFVNEGVQVTAFQKAVSSFLGVDQLVLVNSCTSALTLALTLAGAGPGADVVTTPMTCIATNTPIANLGARIVWADIDPKSGLIDPSDVERKITPATKAIMVVAWAGTPVDLDALDAIAKRHGIPLIHDAAHAFGATWKGRPLSDFADFTCYSFQAIKHLSSGDGGAIVCRDAKAYVLARKLKWFGYDRDAHKDEKGDWKGQSWEADIAPGEVGFKYNMNNVSAAIGLSQMPHIGAILSAHRRNAAVYDKAFAAHAEIKPAVIPPSAVSSYWVYTAHMGEGARDRDSVLKALNDEGIAAGLVHLPNDLYSAFKPYETPLPGVRAFAARQISLPCGWWLSAQDCEHIAARTLALAAN